MTSLPAAGRGIAGQTDGLKICRCGAGRDAVPASDRMPPSHTPLWSAAQLYQENTCRTDDAVTRSPQHIMHFSKQTLFVFAGAAKAASRQEALTGIVCANSLTDENVTQRPTAAPTPHHRSGGRPWCAASPWRNHHPVYAANITPLERAGLRPPDSAVGNKLHAKGAGILLLGK